MTLRAVCFCAVSDPAQLKNDSIDQQKSRGQELIQQRGWREVHPPLEVPGISRNWDFLTDAEREVPAIAELLRLAREELVDLVIVRRYNRLARTNALLQQISAYLHRHRVQIFAWEEPVEPLPPADLGRRRDAARLMVEGISGVLAEADQGHRIKRKADGMLTRIQRGGHPAGVAPYGYMDIIDPTGGVGRSHKRRVVNPAEYPTLCEVLRMLKAGYTSADVAARLEGTPGRRGGPISRFVILQWAQNPYYYGKTYLGWYPVDRAGKRQRQRKEPLLLVDSNHECPMTWDDRAIILRNIHARDTAPVRSKGQRRPWSGLAFCGFCLDEGRSGTMRYRVDIQRKGAAKGRRYELLCCNHYSTTGGRGCRRNAIRLGDFLDALYETIALAARDPVARAAMDGKAPPKPDEAERLRRELAALDGAERRWDEAFGAGVIDLAKYGERLQETRQRREELAAQLRQVERLREATGEVRRQRDQALDDFAATLAAGEPWAISRTLRQIVERVIVRDRELTVTWR